MLWKIAIHGGHLHPDFIRDKLTERQLHEIAWYYNRHPFGCEIDHIMIARVIASLVGGKPEDYMPKFAEELTTENMVSSMSGLSQFLADNEIEE